MKRLVRIVLLASLVVAAAAVAALFIPASRTQAATARFSGFAVDSPRIIHFSVDEDVDLDGVSPDPGERSRHRKDQLRDWCLLAVIQDSGLPARDIGMSIYDLPAIRRETLRRIANFENGVTRSVVIGANQVIALIPSDVSSAAKKDYLAHIADEQRKNLGAQPGELLVFEYALDDGSNIATIVHRASVFGSQLFSANFGYVEAQIASLEDLERFQAAADDLTYARMDDHALTLGGRRHLAALAPGERPRGRIGAEEIAAIWQAQQGLPDTRGVGFSLDPRLDLPKIAHAFQPVIVPILNGSGVSPSTVDGIGKLVNTKIADDQTATRQKEIAIREALAQACGVNEPCQNAIRSVLWENSFQTARYEGRHLAGTEAGMVLFYTDLLMKLWSFDYSNSTPRYVPGFPVKTEMRVSTVFKKEFGRNNATRFWLGPLPSGYLVQSKRPALFFAPNSARIFAHAHDYLTDNDSQEEEPNVFDRVFVNWWNDHFEEIARYEPQYERLNEIVKWGILSTWLGLNDHADSLRFLSDNSPHHPYVKRNWAIQDWGADPAKSLTYTNWRNIAFDPPGNKRGEYDSLEILHSKTFELFDEKSAWQGGVDLASRSVIEESAAASRALEELPLTVRRGGIDTLESSLSAGKITNREATFQFRELADQIMSTVGQARPSARLSDAYGELENVAFDKTIRSSSAQLTMSTRAGGQQMIGDLGELRIFKSAGGSEVQWYSRDIDLGQSMARRLSESADPGTLFMEDPQVEASIRINGGNTWLVKARNGGRWIKLTEGVDESRVGAGYQARVAGLSDNAKVVDVAWLDGERLERELPEHDFVQIAFGKDSADVRIECCVHDAPSGQQFRFKTAESAEFGAVRDAGGHTWARVSDLPEEIRRDPSLLSTEPRLAGEDLRLAQALEEGEFAQAGSQLARDPALYNERLERILTSDLRENDRLIALRQWSLANEQLRAAISIHGRLPELTYRQALLEAVADRPAGIASALNNSFPRPIADADRFFSQLNESLANAPSPAVKENLAKIGDFADWNAKASKSGDVFVIGDNGRAELALNLDRVPAGRVLDGSEVSSIFAQNRPAVYVASEHPELRSLDPFTPAGQRSLTQLVASKRVTLRELQMSDVAHYRPALVVPRGADSSFQWHIAHGAERTLSEAGRYVRAQSNGCDSDKDPNCRVYVIEGRNGQ